MPRKTKVEGPSTQAAGDAAVAAGMTKVAGTELVSTGDDQINVTRDYIATYATRKGPLLDIWVQATAPAHKAGRIWIKST